MSNSNNSLATAFARDVVGRVSGGGVMASDEAKAGAIGLVNDFRTRGLSMWGAIRREQLADGLIVRINDPPIKSIKSLMFQEKCSYHFNRP
jgi:hypothetical protein